MTPTYDVRTLDLALPWDDPAARGWGDACQAGFLQAPQKDEHARRRWAEFDADAARIRGVYTAGPRHALPDTTPVATFASFDKTLNAGGDLVPANLVSDVTVRPTHRRRGLLRQLMDVDLAEARERGCAASVLTASEGAIYGRFGFGIASQSARVEVASAPGRFALRTAPEGICELADVSVLPSLMRTVFGRWHAAHRGSIDRPAWYDDFVGGFDPETGEQANDYRAVLHYDDTGEVDGYALFKAVEETPPTVRIHDLVASTPAAELALWHALAHIDLTDRVTFSRAPLDVPLPWAMVDPRGYRIVEVRDMVWLRVHDVPALLQARSWGRDGTLCLAVHDPLGHADGSFRVEVTNGRATVTPSRDEPDLDVGVEALGSLSLGGVGVGTLVTAGRARSTAVSRVAGIVDVAAPPSCLTPF